jgi:hypothetical protein
MSAPRKNFEHGMLVSQGVLDGQSSVHKFGATPQMSINTTGTVWDINDTLYPWTALDTPAVVNVERNNASDNGLVVTVEGLDSDWAVQTEDITISGADQVGTKLFRRVNRAYITSATATTNAGDIDIEAGAAGGTTVARITAGLGQTLMAVYTVPAGYKGYLYQGTASVEQGGDATGYMYVRRNGTGTTFRIGHTFEVTSNGGYYNHKFPFPVELDGKSDIDVRAKVRSNNSRITAAFDILLIEQDPNA